MIYWLAEYLIPVWGPLRLLQSHVVLLTGGTFVAAMASLFLLPRLWNRLPRDRGKTLCKDLGGMQSAGKPTGAGFWVTLVALPVVLLFAPLAPWDLAALGGIYAAMLFGYLDDRANMPWGELKKGLLDVVCAFAIAAFIFCGHAEEIAGMEGLRMITWVPFAAKILYVPAFVYVPVSAFVLFVTMNATNCSDGVDGLAGTLTLIELVILSVILYVVVGYRPVAHYFLIPCYSEAARWAIVTMAAAGAFGGYLWYNAEPSRILMGDAGSRFLGILIATASLMTGNPFLVLALSPVVLVNGGGGLVKLVILRVARRLGFEIGDENLLKRIRFPLHDHCKKKLGWSNAQVLMRFTLLQLVVMPVLLIILLKVR